MTEADAAISQFDTAIAAATSSDAAFLALQTLAQALVPSRLFTVMTVDMRAELARRAYTSDPTNYPASGTKPIRYDSWFDIVHKDRRIFVANTLADIAKVFPDHALIGSLGCGSVVNMPVILRGELVATVNLLDAEQAYSSDRVALIERQLSIPAKLACAIARS